MKFAIIGAGNMGAAIAIGLSSAPEKHHIVVSNPTQAKLDALRARCPGIATTTDNIEAATDADAIVLCVKPWILPQVIAWLKPTLRSKSPALISIAGGVDIDSLRQMLNLGADCPPLYHVIPDTAIMVSRGMTFIATDCADERLTEQVRQAFATMGNAAVVEQRLMPAATALSSCGIAYAYKYIQACVQAGVQLGFRPADALSYTIATVQGAAEMLSQLGTLPQQEIDRVTTPGGMTIKGVNELEHKGFTSAVISAILKPVER